MDLYQEIDRYYRKLKACEPGSKAYAMYQDVISHIEKIIKT